MMQQKVKNDPRTQTAVGQKQAADAYADLLLGNGGLSGGAAACPAGQPRYAAASILFL